MLFFEMQNVDMRIFQLNVDNEVLHLKNITVLIKLELIY